MENEVIRPVVTALEVPKAISDVIKGSVKEFALVIDYEKSLHKNYERLTEEANKLYARRDKVVAKINKDKLKQPTEECKAWLDKVHDIEREVFPLEVKYSKELEHQGLDRFLERSNLSYMIMEKCDEVQRCWEDGSIFLTEALVDKPPGPVIIIKEAPNIENLQSLHEIIEEILECLRNKDVKRIGLWGKVGVGKTAIMQNLNNNKEVATTFDLVIFATLADEGNEEKSQCVDEKLKRAKQKLQHDIAQRLKLGIEGITNAETIASRISTELESKRYLLLLDEVWDKFNLDDIGIQENEEDSKVVLACRHPNIHSGMDVDEEIYVRPLSDTEARKLFFEKLRPSMIQSDTDRTDRKKKSDIDQIADLVIKECANLPLVIDRVARTFRKIERRQQPEQRRITSWRAALERLRKWPNVEFQGMDEFLDRLRHCYEELDGEDKKMCFLYGALYPNGYDIYIDHLLECWRAEGFIRDAEKLTVRYGGVSILEDLIDVSLLEDAEKKKHIKMNKVLRSLALKISSKSENSIYLVRTGENLLEPSDREEWKGAQWISLIDNKLCSLPENPDCENLSTLMLQRNDNLKQIPHSFFHSVKSLYVLNLHGTGITTLPASISCLTCLRVLYLNSCNQLKQLPPEIGALDKLEVLDIQDTGIYCLPVQIKDLHQLRCLRMSLSNSDSKAQNVEIGQNFILYLSLLEELVIDVHPQNQWWNGVVIAVSEEVAKLENLISLSLCFPEVDSFKKFITACATWKKEDLCFAFHFSVGNFQSKRYKVFDYYEYEICRCLKYAGGEGRSYAISEVLAETNAFELIGHKGHLKLSDFGIDNISKIKSCVIESCLAMETIIDATGVTKCILERLERMYICNLPELESMWEGVVPDGSLAQLTTLSFFKCSKLKRIFSRGMIQQLAKLQHLEIQECDEIEEIVMESESNGSEPGQLSGLKTLILHNLPKLKCIWTDNILRCPSLKLSKISECPLLNATNFRDSAAAQV